MGGMGDKSSCQSQVSNGEAISVGLSVVFQVQR